MQLRGEMSREDRFLILAIKMEYGDDGEEGMTGDAQVGEDADPILAVPGKLWRKFLQEYFMLRGRVMLLRTGLASNGEMGRRRFSSHSLNSSSLPALKLSLQPSVGALFSLSNSSAMEKFLRLLKVLLPPGVTTRCQKPPSLPMPLERVSVAAQDGGGVLHSFPLVSVPLQAVCPL